MTLKQYPEFLVGWGSFHELYKKPEGFLTFILVDDYTMSGLNDELTAEFLPRKEDVFEILTAFDNIASNELYAKAGVVRPAISQIPVVFCVTHGKPTGTYILNATAESAKEFVLTQVETAEGNSTGK